MTDLEMTKLCAEAMGYRHHTVMGRDLNPDGRLPLTIESTQGMMRYDPLHDDAQAMALVKRFRLQVTTPDWTKPLWQSLFGQTNYHGISENLNRAIVECVAKMKKAGNG